MRVQLLPQKERICISIENVPSILKVPVKVGCLLLHLSSSSSLATSTFGLTNATIPYAVKLADMGFRRAASLDPGLAGGINMTGGKITHRQVAESFDMPYSPLPE